PTPVVPVRIRRKRGKHCRPARPRSRFRFRPGSNRRRKFGRRFGNRSPISGPRNRIFGPTIRHRWTGFSALGQDSIYGRKKQKI
uniref:Coat protein n=1 Tax=Romanomermis culicivorax TaxID=13658 RepID=A0A915KIS6_ROMCU